MGRELILIPVDTHGTGRVSFGHQLINTLRRDELYDAVAVIERHVGMDVPRGFKTFRSLNDDGKPAYGVTETTPYDEPLKMVPVGHLKQFANILPVQDNWQNRAVWAYLDQMPDDWWVALYWN